MKRAVLALMVVVCPGATGAGVVDGVMQKLSESEFDFARVESNVPFPEFAWIHVADYGESTLRREGGDGVPFDVRTLSQGLLLPAWVGKRDIVLVGEWVGASQFRFPEQDYEDTTVVSIAVPAGWVHQGADRWQVGAFVMPMAHSPLSDDGGWGWEAMGGLFGRWRWRDNVYLIVGGFADVTSGTDYYLPYVGMTWLARRDLSVSLVLPWPGITYAPTDRWMVRAGLAPSGGSWTVDADGDNVAMSFDAWDLSLSTEYRVANRVWVGGAFGRSGFRGIAHDGGGDTGAAADIEPANFVRLTVGFRP